MIPDQGLFLHEELMLLAIRDEEGTVAAGQMFQYILAGALVAELLLRRRITVEASKRKLVSLLDPSPVDDPLLDECLQRLEQAQRRASLKTWVSRWGGLRKIKQRTAEQLCRQGILRQAEDKVLLVFSRKIYPQVDPGPEQHIIERLREAIFSDSDTVDPRTTVLLSLAHHGELLKNIFGKSELKGRQKRIKQVIDGEMTAKAAKEVMEAVQAAVVVACIIPAIAYSASST